MVKYFLRLDDLCPTNNRAKWERFFNLCDANNIKPLVAVIPANKDPKLLSCGQVNEKFWDLSRELQNKNYILAMHGYDHAYITDKGGLFKINFRSEFAGLPLYLQEEKIKKAQEIFNEQNINVNVFIAPAHTFDENTLFALKNHSKIDIISDGLGDKPYKRFGFKWIPVQLAEAVYRPENVWTFNYHPETCSDKKFNELEQFIHKYHHLFGNIDDLTYQEFSWKDKLQEDYRINKRFLIDKLKDVIKLLKN